MPNPEYVATSVNGLGHGSMTRRARTPCTFGSALDGSGHQTTDEPAAEDDVDQQSRCGDDECACEDLGVGNDLRTREVGQSEDDRTVVLARERWVAASLQ